MADNYLEKKYEEHLEKKKSVKLKQKAKKNPIKTRKSQIENEDYSS